MYTVQQRPGFESVQPIIKWEKKDMALGNMEGDYIYLQLFHSVVFSGFWLVVYMKWKGNMYLKNSLLNTCRGLHHYHPFTRSGMTASLQWLMLADASKR